MKSTDDKPISPIIISFPARTPGDGAVSWVLAVPGRGWQAICRGIDAWSPLHFWLMAAMVAVIVGVAARSAIVHKRDQQLVERLRADLRAEDTYHSALEAAFLAAEADLVKARAEIASLELLTQAQEARYGPPLPVSGLDDPDLAGPPRRRQVSGGAASIHRSSANPDAFRGAPVPGTYR